MCKRAVFSKCYTEWVLCLRANIVLYLAVFRATHWHIYSQNSIMHQINTKSYGAKLCTGLCYNMNHFHNNDCNKLKVHIIVQTSYGLWRLTKILSSNLLEFIKKFIVIREVLIGMYWLLLDILMDTYSWILVDTHWYSWILF